MRFIVYDAVPVTSDRHRILRWGDAPADLIEHQAGAGEVAVAATTGFPEDPDTTGKWHYYVYDVGDAAIYRVDTVYQDPETATDKQARLLGLIRAALKESEWALLSDCTLAASKKTEMVNWRAWLRSIPSSGPSWETGTYDLTPPYTEI